MEYTLTKERMFLLNFQPRTVKAREENYNLIYIFLEVILAKYQYIIYIYINCLYITHDLI